jgi:hypothetical protein
MLSEPLKVRGGNRGGSPFMAIRGEQPRGTLACSRFRTFQGLSRLLGWSLAEGRQEDGWMRKDPRAINVALTSSAITPRARAAAGNTMRLSRTSELPPSSNARRDDHEVVDWIGPLPLACAGESIPTEVLRLRDYGGDKEPGRFHSMRGRFSGRVIRALPLGVALTQSRHL